MGAMSKKAGRRIVEGTERDETPPGEKKRFGGKRKKPGEVQKAASGGVLFKHIGKRRFRRKRGWPRKGARRKKKKTQKLGKVPGEGKDPASILLEKTDGRDLGRKNLPSQKDHLLGEGWFIQINHIPVVEKIVLAL